MSDLKERKEAYLLDYDPHASKISIFKWFDGELTYKPVFRFIPSDNSSTVLYTALTKYLGTKKKFITDGGDKGLFYLNEEDGEALLNLFQYFRGIQSEGDKFLFFEVVQPLLSFASSDLKKLNSGLCMWKLLKNLENVKPVEK